MNVLSILGEVAEINQKLQLFYKLLPILIKCKSAADKGTSCVISANDLQDIKEYLDKL